MQAVVREREEADVLPNASEPLRIQTNWLLGSNGIDGKGSKGLCQFVATKAANEFHRADMVLVKALGELFQYRIQGIRRDSLDDQLTASDAD